MEEVCRLEFYLNCGIIAEHEHGSLQQRVRLKHFNFDIFESKNRTQIWIYKQQQLQWNLVLLGKLQRSDSEYKSGI